MSITLPKPRSAAPRNLCEILLCDLTSLLVTSRSITASLQALGPECAFSPEITEKIDDLISVSREGEGNLRELLRETGIILPTEVESGSGALISLFFDRLPAGASPGVLATEVLVNLRLLTQHLELKARLAAEAAVLVGQESLRRVLVAWAVGWCACGQNLRATTFRARAQAYVADVSALAVRHGMPG